MEHRIEQAKRVMFPQRVDNDVQQSHFARSYEDMNVYE